MPSPPGPTYFKGLARAWDGMPMPLRPSGPSAVGSRADRTLSRAATLFEERFQLGDRFEVLGPSRRALDLDQRLEAEAAAVDSVDLPGHTVGEQLRVRASADDLAKHVHIPDVRGQREVQPALDGLRVPAEW